ncbi:serine/threonine-protein phosphatase 7 long form [Dorcoceras hygrometricum]|uniref:Serine/threonine-protein phosphatase 7 long form n=1 Tax=Dorcoceras hygrometricum TaxID=472368 RepID=A0A2Z7BR91_9LAMI|nr:serine/threonine-protein phosphatase 7 long form [Dorcoceras hygrometricum]
MSLFDLQDVCIAIGSLATLDLPMVVDLIGIYGLKGPYPIGSLATLDLPMVVDLIGIYGLKGPYRTLTTTDWFLQALSVIPRGSWGDVARCFTMIRWAVDRSDLIGDRSYDEVAAMDIVIWTRARWPPPPSLSHAGAAAAVFAGKLVSGQLDEENPFVLISSGLLVQPDEGVSDLVMDRIGVNYRNLPRRAGFLKDRLEPGTSASKANHHRAFVDAWADRHSLVVETEFTVNFCMTDDYASWYDLITRRFVSPIDPVQVDSGYQPGDAYFRRVMRDGTSTIANICKGVAIEDLSREDLVEALTKSIATAAFLHELTLKTPQQQQHQARTSTRRRQGRGDNRRIGDDLQSFDTPDWRQSTSQTPLTSVSHQTSSGADVGPTFRDVGPSYVFSSPLSSSFFDFSQGSGGNDQEDQRTEHQQSDFQTPPAYTTYQDSFIEGIFGGISHQYGGEHQTFDTSPVPYIGYSLPDSTAASASQVPPEYVVEREDEDDYQAPNIIRRSRRVPRAPDCGTGHRLGHRFGRG